MSALERAVHGGDDALLVQSVRRLAGTLLVTGQHPVLRYALSRLHERSAPDDPWLALCSALIDVETGAPAATRAALDRVARLWPAEPDCRLEILRSVTELFAAAWAADLTAAPTRPGEQCVERDAPEWTALALAATGGVALLVDADREAASAAFQEALDIARRHGFGYLEMQCCALLAAAGGMAGDYPAMTTAATGTLVTAVAGGWDGSLWSTAGRCMLAYGALLRCEPAEARDVAAEALRQRTTARSPRLDFALRVVHGAALFDGGSRHRGLQEMQKARADLGAVSLADEQAALAVLEHRAALALGRPDIARAVADWLSRRSGAGGEVLLMRAWTALSTGRDQAARAAVRPLLDGSVTGLLPHTIVEALLVETTAGVTAGEVYGARRALRTALSLGAPLDAIRPFAMAEPPARALLGHHLGRSRTTEPFVARALAAGRGAHPTPTIPLTDTELAMIKLLPSPLSTEQIAVELNIAGSEEAHGMLRTVYRKLGASSRRTAAAAAFERRLLR